MEKAWEKNFKAVYGLAKDFNASYPLIPIEDYISAGHEIFVDCFNKYDEKISNGACFNTYLHASLKGSFKGMISENIKKKMTEEPAESLTNMSDLESDILDPERMLRFKQALIEMSEDSILVVNLIFNAPSDFIDIMKTATTTRGDLRHYLRTIWHGDEIQTRISNAFKEIKSTLQNI